MKKKYSCKISKGTSNSQYISEDAYEDVDIQILSGNEIEVKYSKSYLDYISFNHLSNSFFNITLVFFLVFFALSLGFNLIFYLLVPSSAQILPPKIILGIFLLVSVVPIIVNIKDANKKIRLDMNSNEFLRIKFASKTDKQSFMEEISGLTNKMESQKQYNYVNVSYNNRFYENIKINVLAKNEVKIEGTNITEEYLFYKKDHNTLWFLYIFFGIFLAAPIFTISTALANGTFEKGMLSTIILGVAGFGGLFFPPFLSKGNLYLYCDDKKVFVKFQSSKERNLFEKKLKYANYVDKSSYNTSKGYQVDLTKNYEILDSMERLNDIVPFVLLSFFTLLFLAGFFTLFINKEIVTGIIMFVMFLLFFTLNMFVFKENNFIIRKRLARKKMMKKGRIIFGEIKYCTTKLFQLGKHIIYDASLTIQFLNEKNKIIEKTIHRKYKEDKRFCVGQRVMLCSFNGTYLFFKGNLLDNNHLLEELNQENETIFIGSKVEDKYDLLLKNQENDFKISGNPKSIIKHMSLVNIMSMMILMPLLSIILYVGISVIIHNKNDKTQITLATIFLIVFGTIIGGLFLFTFLTFVKGIINKINEKKFLKNANMTMGYISEVDEFIWYVKSGDSGSRVAKVRYLINYKYKDSNNQIITKSIKKSGYLIFSRSYKKGQEIVVFFDNKKSIPLEL